MAKLIMTQVHQQDEFDPVIGVIGLGNMGLPIALNLINDGFKLKVLDKRSEPVKACIEAGAEEAADVASIADDCDIFQLVVENDEEVLSIVTDEGGILSKAESNTVIIVHSTVTPQTMIKLSEKAKEKGVVVLDAPMSGGDIGAKEGTLTLMLGGPTEYVEHCQPIFNTIGDDIFHTGSIGAGQAAKLANNIMAHGNHLVALEAIKLADAYGIDEQTMVSVAEVSTGRSWMTENWGFYDRYLEEHTFAGSNDLYFFLRHATNDALDAAAARNVALPLTGLCAEYRPIALAERHQKLENK
jgi:3-hydroxyisobutyrate dehydrogenase-like beta-hydroxyacid dehydrogenase